MASIGGVGKRAAAMILALLFLFTAVGFSAAIVWQIRQDSKNEEATKALSNSLQNSGPACDNQAIDAAANLTAKGGAKFKGAKLGSFTPVGSIPTLTCIDAVVGTGVEAKAGSTITANYTGAVAKDGVIFESSIDGGQPFSAQLDVSRLIAGWVQGIAGMKAGGIRRLMIPSSLAYGTTGNAGIPPNTDLVFDIQLLGVN